MTSLFCAHCFPASRPFKSGNRAGGRVRSFDLANEAQQMGEMAKFARCPVSKKQLQTARIISVPFI
jgi:hypothetical protein